MSRNNNNNNNNKNPTVTFTTTPPEVDVAALSFSSLSSLSSLSPSPSPSSFSFSSSSSSGYSGTSRSSTTVQDLQNQVNRTCTLALSHQPAAEKNWKQKCAALERKVGKLQQQLDLNARAAQAQREKFDKERAGWEQLKNRLLQEGEQKEAALFDLEAKCEDAVKRWMAAKEILEQPKNTAQKRLYEKQQESERRARELSFQLRARELEIELLQMRLLEEEDVDRVWRYKYLGTL